MEPLGYGSVPSSPRNIYGCQDSSFGQVRKVSVGRSVPLVWARADQGSG
ncbi:hypothetical protein NBRC3257_2567 [Gluconobacter thailandicus NBRC 3257]|uniref:Uncharacterized protein n=1 Tax=Gluconobacter thailandicus NBRC 3257 TaxID=1381097 RepID=A0ABQ0IZD7_GLUTH|nr:hypothetical protein NBRC3255_2814 [Gluconobacter thailandicus NBRC 3255]GAD27568.1 hypothetical protein NBRC3257_2567 [Gluconobacter thailandicus NBRC 3257]